MLTKLIKGMYLEQQMLPQEGFEFRCIDQRYKMVGALSAL